MWVVRRMQRWSWSLPLCRVWRSLIAVLTSRRKEAMKPSLRSFVLIWKMSEGAFLIQIMDSDPSIRINDTRYYSWQILNDGAVETELFVWRTIKRNRRWCLCKKNLGQRTWGYCEVASDQNPEDEPANKFSIFKGRNNYGFYKRYFSGLPIALWIPNGTTFSLQAW